VGGARAAALGVPEMFAAEQTVEKIEVCRVGFSAAPAKALSLGSWSVAHPL